MIYIFNSNYHQFETGILKLTSIIADKIELFTNETSNKKLIFKYNVDTLKAKNVFFWVKDR
jgi:hypothetical protein